MNNDKQPYSSALTIIYGSLNFSAIALMHLIDISPFSSTEKQSSIGSTPFTVTPNSSQSLNTSSTITCTSSQVEYFLFAMWFVIIS